MHSLFTWVDRRARAYADRQLHPFLAKKGADRRRIGERELLDSFNKHVEAVVAECNRPQTRLGTRPYSDGLLFARSYATLDRSLDPRAPVSPEVLVALLGAEVEYRGPLRLSRTQNRKLAEVFEQLGDALARGLPGHATLAFRRAWSLYRQDEDNHAEDRCSLKLARARRRAQPARWRRAVSYFPDLVCGYGYRPYQMLLWIVLQVIVSIAFVRALSPAPTLTVVYDCAMNYLNPLGPSDTAGLVGTDRILFVVQAYLGAVSMDVFFALLVRRWFRL